jgi:hypothetical protein
LVTLIAVPATTFAAGGIVVPPGPAKGGPAYNQPKMKPQKVSLRFLKSGEIMLGGKKRLAASFAQVIGSGSLMAYVGQDPKTNENLPEIEATVTHLREGDVVNLELEQIGGQYNIKYAKLIELKEGEETPHGYVYKESYNEQGTGAALVRLTKYDISYEVMLPYAKGADAKGTPEPDPDMVSAVQALKADQPVYAQMAPSGQKQVLVAIFPYKEPQTGKITKVSDQTIDAGKTQAVDIETSDGKTVTALVPGKLYGKKWQPDPIIKGLVHGFKPGAEVTFLTHDEGGKTFLVEISKTPPAPKTPAAKPDKPEKMEKPTGKPK